MRYRWPFLNIGATLAVLQSFGTELELYDIVWQFFEYAWTDVVWAWCFSWFKVAQHLLNSIYCELDLVDWWYELPYFRDYKALLSVSFKNIKKEKALNREDAQKLENEDRMMKTQNVNIHYIYYIIYKNEETEQGNLSLRALSATGTLISSFARTRQNHEVISQIGKGNSKKESSGN